MSELAQRSFPHQRLEVYRLAVELAVLARESCAQVPRNYRHLVDQLSRSSSAVVLLIAEGANRLSSPQKRQRFVEARGECGESAANVELLHGLGLVRRAECEAFQALAARIGQMLTALIRVHS